MRLLMDTHILLWCLQDSKELPSEARRLISSADKVFASTVNIWEIIIKIGVGKLEIKFDMKELLPAIYKGGFDILDIKPLHAIKLLELEDRHKDPFDRMLIAQSLVEPLHLLTSDKIVAEYNTNIIKV